MSTNSHPKVSMVDLSRHQSLGSALGGAVDKNNNKICLIEADRERENHQLSYRDFREAAMPLAKYLQDCGFNAGSRAAIIMTNQSCWPIAAYAVFYAGGVLVPIDYKLTAHESLALLAHSKAEVLVTEYHLWRAITQLEPGKVSGATATGSTSDRSLPLPDLRHLQ